MAYTDRIEAGRELANALRHFEGQDPVVLALPRGGVILGAEIAKVIQAPLGLILVRKIGHPLAPEYAIGAVAEGTDQVLYNENEVVTIEHSLLKQAEKSARQRMKEQRDLYYGDKIKPLEIKDKVAIVVDDGIATGFTMRAAIEALRQQKPKRVIVAAPVGSEEAIADLEKLADEIVVLDEPEDFLGSIGAHYQKFDQVEDDEVKATLEEANKEFAASWSH